MPGGNGRGPGGGGGQGQGRGRGRGQGRGMGGGPFAAGPGGACVCSACGYREPHGVRQPCNERKCPKCGALMTRE